MKPRALRPGDRIALVSPSSPVKEEDLHAAESLLGGWGYVPVRSPHALDRADHLAGTDAHRAADLQAAFADPGVAAVYCTRGGYGAARLLPRLNLEAIAQAGKLFLGFSDITTLHAALNRRGLPTVHAPMALTLSRPREPWVAESLRRVLAGQDPVPAEAPRAQTLVGGQAEAPVSGGCLCLLCDSIGTPDEVEIADRILLIEDVDEAPHRVDAMLTHLLNHGAIARAAGIVVGEMTRTDEKTDEGIGGRPWREIVRERLAPLGLPLVTDYPFGHAPQMLSLPLGIRARLDADAGTLTYTEALCA